MLAGAAAEDDGDAGRGRRGGLGLRGVSTVLIARDPIARHPAAGARAPALRLACARGPPAPRRPRPRLDRWSSRRPAAARARRPRSTRPLVLASTYVADGDGRLRPRTATRPGRRSRTRSAALEGGAALVFASGHGGGRRGPVARRPTAAPSSRRRTPTTAPASSCGDLAPRGRMTVRAGRHHRHRGRRRGPATARTCSGSSRRPTRCSRSPTCRPSSRPRTSAGATVVVRQHVRHAAAASGRSTLGADVVVHSVTKYLSGHSDVLLGAAVTADTDAGRAAYERLPTHRADPRRDRRADGGLAGPARAAHPAPAGRARAGQRRRARGAAGRPPGVSSGSATPASARSSSIEVRRRRRGRRAGRRRRPGCGCTPPASAASSRRSSGGAGIAAEPLTVPENLLRLSVGIEDVDDLWRDLAPGPRRPGPPRLRPVRVRRPGSACRTRPLRRLGLAGPRHQDLGHLAGRRRRGRPRRRARRSACRRRGGGPARGSTRRTSRPRRSAGSTATTSCDASCPGRGCSPKVRLRDSGDMQVAMRSPSPASPAKVTGSAPSATPSRAVSARPRVMIEALVLSPMPMPSAMPTASAMTFLTAPPSSVPTTSVLV